MIDKQPHSVFNNPTGDLNSSVNKSYLANSYVSYTDNNSASYNHSIGQAYNNQDPHANNNTATQIPGKDVESLGLKNGSLSLGLTDDDLLNLSVEQLNHMLGNAR